MADQVDWFGHALKGCLEHGMNGRFHAEFVGVKLERPSLDADISAQPLAYSLVQTVQSWL